MQGAGSNGEKVGDLKQNHLRHRVVILHSEKCVSNIKFSKVFKRADCDSPYVYPRVQIYLSEK